MPLPGMAMMLMKLSFNTRISVGMNITASGFLT
jgi:hypothetical protein